MTRKTVIELTSDLSGEAAAETVDFSIDRKPYRIDLTTDEASELRDALARYTASGHRMSKQEAAKAFGPASRANRVHRTQVREWAKENGYEIGGRGRISQEVQAAYDAAQA